MIPEKDFKEPGISHLDTFHSIDMEGDWKKVRKRMGFGKKKMMMRIWQAAAAVILLLAVGFLAQQYLFNAPEMVIASAGDHQLEVILPDGSAVTLNKQAGLTYPEKFHRKQREVQLSGEGFFEVEPDPDRPFRVQVESEAIVEVLGTSFNIRPDTQDGSISVQVAEGRVAFSQVGKESERIVMEKDEQATLLNGLITKENTINKNFLSWKTGILYFDQELIGDVVRQLELHYGREIILESNVPIETIFTSTIDNQDLESILEEMGLVLDLDVEFNNDKVTISYSN
ncbi:MAG: FecR domain-containing protein, partial [Bacteroidales bacterium]|nr:FecR domain-containing protein [Bacteroidales bacterium]